jgi:DNA-binding transcriptional LysR family regulator
MDDARNAISGVVELTTGSLDIAALATLPVDPMATLIGRFREHHPGVQIRVLEPECADGVRALVGDGACEIGAAHLPLPGDQLIAHPLGEQELLFVFPPDAAADRHRPVGAKELAQTPLVVSPPGTSTRMLPEQALAAVHIAPGIAVETAAREAIVPLVLAGAGAALLPAPQASQRVTGRPSVCDRSTRSLSSARRNCSGHRPDENRQGQIPNITRGTTVHRPRPGVG